MLIVGELEAVERELLRAADDVEDADVWSNHGGVCTTLRALARRVAVQIETIKLREAA